MNNNMQHPEAHDPKALRALSQAFAREHLAVLSQELLQWDRSAIRPDGRFDELNKMVIAWAGAHDSMSIAKRVVEIEALKVVAGELPTPIPDDARATTHRLKP